MIDDATVRQNEAGLLIKEVTMLLEKKYRWIKSLEDSEYNDSHTMIPMSVRQFIKIYDYTKMLESLLVKHNI